MLTNMIQATVLDPDLMFLPAMVASIGVAPIVDLLLEEVGVTLVALQMVMEVRLVAPLVAQAVRSVALAVELVQAVIFVALLVALAPSLIVRAVVQAVIFVA
jgi:hypothetical protein